MYEVGRFVCARVSNDWSGECDGSIQPDRRASAWGPEKRAPTRSQKQPGWTPDFGGRRDQELYVTLVYCLLGVWAECCSRCSDPNR